MNRASPAPAACRARAARPAGELLAVGHRLARRQPAEGGQHRGQPGIRAAHGRTDGVELPLFADGQAHGAHLPPIPANNYRITM